jgi:hypothetical protein
MFSITAAAPTFLATFFISLLSQINDPTHVTHLDYQYSPDFLYAAGITFQDGIETPVNSACEDGPSGKSELNNDKIRKSSGNPFLIFALCNIHILSIVLPMDFIIVGGGAAGSILANKIATAFPQKTVLLIEAGGDGFVDTVVK